MQTLGNNNSFFIEQIGRLQAALRGGPYTQEQIDILFNRTKRFKTNHLQKTVDHLITTKNLLPPIGDIITGCRVEAYGDEQKEDQEEKKFAKDFFEGKIPPHGEIMKDSMGLILDSLNGKITKHQLSQKMLTMEELYPGRGWKHEALILTRNRKQEEAKE